MRETISSLLAPLGIEHALQYRRGVPPVVNEEVSTRIITHAIEAIGPDVLADTRSPAAARTSPGISRRCPARWRGWGCGRAGGPQLDLHQPTFDLDERALGGRACDCW